MNSSYSKLLRIFFSKYFIPLFLLIILGLSFYKNIHFALLDKKPPEWDPAAHLLAALDHRDYLLQLHLKDYFFSYHFFPPFIYQLAGFLLIFVPSIAVMPVVFNFLLIILLCVLIYQIYRTKSYLLISVVLFFCLALFLQRTPQYVNIMSWKFMLDIPMSIFLASGYILLLSIYGKTISFKRFLVTTLFFCFSVYTRTPAVSFIFPPLLYLALKVISQRKYKYLAVFGVFAFPISWYLTNLEANLAFNKLNIFDQPGPITAYFSQSLQIVSWLWVIPLLAVLFFVHDHLQDFSFSKTLVKLVKRPSAELFILMSLTIGSLPLFIIPNKEFRFIFPTLLILFLVSAQYIIQKSYWLSTVLSIGVLGLFVFRTIYYFPIPTSQSSGYTFVRDFIDSHPNSTIAYYFEEDSYRYNLVNINLLNKQRSRFFIFSNNPELNAPVGDNTTCNLSPDAEFFISHSTANERSPERTFPVEASCAERLNEYKFRPVQEEHFPQTNETLRIYMPSPETK